MADPEEMLRRHVAALRDDAKMMELAVEHFRPEWDGCWSDEKVGHGHLINHERGLQLRKMVLTNRDEAKYCRQLADAIETLLPEPSEPKP